MPRIWRNVLGGIAGVLFAAPALAVDGVIEINQAAVFAGGITPGDTPGFPATLSQTGSYRLTGNLDVTKMQNGDPQADPANVTAIEITANNVTVDLNGFSLLGPTACSPQVSGPPTCSPSGTGSGVLGNGVAAIAIVNGTISGMANFGVDLNNADNVRIERLAVRDSGFTAVRCGQLCMVLDANIERAGGNGFGSTQRAVVRNTIVTDVVMTGIDVGTGIISGSFVARAQTGISSGQSPVIDGNTIENNRGDGLGIPSGTITNNVVRSNGGDGIQVGMDGAVILGNNILNNIAGLGINAPSSPGNTGFGHNVINGNNTSNANPQVSAGLRQIDFNVCGGDLTCP